MRELTFLSISFSARTLYLSLHTCVCACMCLCSGEWRCTELNDGASLRIQAPSTTVATAPTPSSARSVDAISGGGSDSISRSRSRSRSRSNSSASVVGSGGGGSGETGVVSSPGVVKSTTLTLIADDRDEIFACVATPPNTIEFRVVDVIDAVCVLASKRLCVAVLRPSASCGCVYMYLCAFGSWRIALGPIMGERWALPPTEDSAPVSVRRLATARSHAVTQSRSHAVT